MNPLQERIAQYRKMATDADVDEIAHFRLGQLLMEDGQYEEAVKSFRRTLELSPEFSKVFQLLGTSLMKLGRRDEAVKVLRDGFTVADLRGDNIPREEMAKLLVQLGESAPAPVEPTKVLRGGGDSGPSFHCQRPGCPEGTHARQLPKPPMNDEMGKNIYENVCVRCWEYWLRDLSIKVINEMRLDLSTEQGCQMYDQMMRETLGLQ
jgi:Fe-S cluster biosynthesis and repair protein YggX